MSRPPIPSDEPTDDCHCGGDRPEWDYHHEEGCAATAQAFSMSVSDSLL